LPLLATMNDTNESKTLLVRGSILVVINCSLQYIICSDHNDKVAIFFLAYSVTDTLKSLVGAGEGNCYLNGT
jgi:hypothetical protein